MNKPPEPVIELSKVTKKFRSFKAISDVSVRVEKGEIVGFVGVNGAGKTTTINALLGFTSPTSGSVQLFGVRISPASAHRSHRRIGYASGDMELPDQITGRQYLRFVLNQSKQNHSERLQQLTDIFRPQLDKKIHTLSRGNKQKIALIAAFVTSPDLVILDEPTSGLDPIMQTAFLELIKSEKERGATVFMSSHYLQEVAEVCTRVLLMKNGRIVEDLSSDQLRAAGGKTVHVIASAKIELPKQHAVQIQTSQTAQGSEVIFVFKGPLHLLQEWLAGVKHVTDVTITERTLDAEFRELYAVEEEEES